MTSASFSILIDMVRDGRKLQTIRPHDCAKRGCNKTLTGSTVHKSRFKVGRSIQLFSGLRTKNTVLLGLGVVQAVVVKPYKNITYGDAVADGFRVGYQEGLCDTARWKKYCDPCLGSSCRVNSLSKLANMFLVKNYAPDEETLFEIISWKKVR